MSPETLFSAAKDGGLTVIAAFSMWLVWKISSNCEERMSESNKRLCEVLDKTAAAQEKNATATATLTEVIHAMNR